MPVALRPSPASPASSPTVASTSTPTSSTSSPSHVSADDTLASLQLRYQQNLASQLCQYQPFGHLSHLASAGTACRCPPTQLACTCGASTLSLSALNSQIQAQKTLTSQLELQKSLVSQLELQKTFAIQLEAQQKSRSNNGLQTEGKMEPSHQMDFSSLSSTVGVHKALSAQLEVQKTLASHLEAQKSLAYQLEAQKLLASHLESAKGENAIFNWRWVFSMNSVFCAERNSADNFVYLLYCCIVFIVQYWGNCQRSWKMDETLSLKSSFC